MCREGSWDCQMDISPSFYAVVSPADPKKSERVETFTESEFSHKRESDVWKSRHLKGSETRFTRC